MNELAVKLRDAALCLENDGAFYNDYRRNKTIRSQRVEICSALVRNKLATHDLKFREQLRRYFDDIWSLPEVKLGEGGMDLSDHPTIEFWKDEVCYPPSPQPQPVPHLAEAAEHIDSAVQHLTNVSNSLKEILMSKTTIIKIETKTFVNGVDISTLEDSAVYQLIATQENEIAQLETIQNKPKKLQAEIDKRRDGIKALVDYLDSVDAKA